MKKTIFVAIFSLFVFGAYSQNPFLVKSEVIQSFDISPDGKSACVLWLDLKGNRSIRIKDLSSGAAKTITPPSFVSNGICFLGNDKVLFPMDGSIMACNVTDGKISKLLNLRDTSKLFFVNAMCASIDGLTIYFAGSASSNVSLYIVHVNNGTTKTFQLPDGSNIIDVNPYASAGAIFANFIRNEGQNHRKFMFASDGVCNVWSYATSLEKIVASPYIVQSTNRPNECVVVGKDGIYVIHTTQQHAVCIAKQDNPTNAIEKLRYRPAENGVVYYLTTRHRGVIQQMDINGKKLPDITF